MLIKTFVLNVALETGIILKSGTRERLWSVIGLLRWPNS